MTADLIVVGRFRSGDRRTPPAEAFAAANGRILAVGKAADVLRLRGPGTKLAGDSSLSILPGFVDAHLHFVALARRSGEVDCSAEVCPTVATLLSRLREAAASEPQGSWLLGFGFDEALLAERRAPGLAELDAAVPEHPLRLLHRTGHAALLNGPALRTLGIRESEALLYEPAAVLRGRIPRPDGAVLTRRSAELSVRLLAAGVTTIHDVTPGQGRIEIERLQNLVSAGHVRQRVRAYAAPGSDGAIWARGDDRFRVCGLKVVLTETSGPGELEAALDEADRRGAHVAVHAVEGGALALAVDVLGRRKTRAASHRIEHAALCPPPIAEDIARSGATVVTHPLFLRRFAAKYAAEIPSEQHDWLYPLRRYVDLGVPLALGSDAPIVSPDALAAIGAAVSRRAEDGTALGIGQALRVEEAISAHTAGGAAAAGDAERLGELRAGALADAVILEEDPASVRPERIGSIAVRATVVAGEIGWAA